MDFFNSIHFFEFVVDVVLGGEEGREEGEEGKGREGKGKGKGGGGITFTFLNKNAKSFPKLEADPHSGVENPTLSKTVQTNRHVDLN